MVTRHLDAGHRHAAAALWESCGLTRPWNDPLADFDRAIAGSTSVILGVIQNGALVGTVMVGEDGHRGWVYYLAVADDVRYRGLGSQLMSAAEHWLRSRGVSRLNLMVRQENKAAVAFYEARGYGLSDVMVLQKNL